jgi:putative transposase
MGRKRHTAEEIVSKFRQVDVLTAQGHAVVDAIRSPDKTGESREL